MSWQTKLDASSQNALRQKAAMDLLKQQNAQVQEDPIMAERLQQINRRAPWLTPEQQIAMAKSYASDEAIDRAGEMQGRATYEDQTAVMSGVGRVARGVISAFGFTAKAAGKALDVIPGALEAVTSAGDFVYDKVIDPLKPVTRYGVAALDAVPETIQNVASMLAQTESKRRDLGGFWDSLSIATLLDNPELQGEGFVVGDKFREEQARRARDFRGELNGSAFTIGRGASNLFFTPNSEGYNTASGFIDAIVNILAPDPTKVISKGVRGVTRAAGEVPLLAKADADAFRLALRSEAGLADNLANGSIDIQKFNRFLDEAPTARKLIDDLVGNEDELDIMEGIFDYDITPDMAYALANAKSREEVKAVLTEGWTIGEGTLSSNIYDYRNPTTTITERMPLVNTIRKSRFMRAIPEQQIVVNGDRFDRTKAVRNMVNSARAAGASEDEVRALAKEIVPAFRAGSTADDQYDAYGAYEKTIKLILKKNGVTDGVIKKVIDKPRGEMERLRAYMRDRAGLETDHGTLKTFMEMVKEDLPDDIYMDFLERAGHLGDEVGFARPMQIIELLNRVQTLPDPRELRRLTRNSFFRKILEDGEGGTKLRKGGPGGIFTTSKREKMEYITDQKRYDEIDARVSELTATQANRPIDEVTAEINDLLEEQKGLVRQKRFATGEQNFFFEAIDTLQNAIWKPLALATFGYAIRNSMDAQIRMHFGANTGVFHPIEYFNLLTNKKAVRSILGDGISEVKGDEIEKLRKVHQDFLQYSAQKQNLGMGEIASHMRKTNMWTTVTRGGADGFKAHTEGIIQQGRLAYRDPLQSMVARGLALGKGEDEVIEMTLAIAKQKDNYDEIKGIFKRGAEYVNVDGTRVQAPPIDFDKLDPKRVEEYLRMHIKGVVMGNVKNNSGNIPAMLYMFGFNKIPMMDLAQTRPLASLRTLDGEAAFEGAIVNLDRGGQGIVARVSGAEATVIPVHTDEAFAGMNGSALARKLINEQPLYDARTNQGLPQQVAKEIIIGRGEDKGFFQNFQGVMDSFTDKVFGDWYNDKYVNVLEKNVVFRKFYYETISENINRLDAESAKSLLAKLKAGASKENTTVAKYIGDAKVAKKIEDIATVGSKGKATAEELDDYARFIALQKSKRLLYDASERNNLTDILRVVMPFAGAWRDIIGTYMGFSVTQNVRMARSFQRVYTGAQNADPDRDGRGFFYEDPQTGKLMFTFPASRGIANLVQKAIPGGGPVTQAILEAPVKQLSQGINVFPALGPMAQIAASELLPDVPEYNSIREVLLPYGPKGVGTVFNVVPGWAQKMDQVIRADTRNTTTAYFNTFSEVYRAKAASGQYDLSREDEKERLYNDSKWDARWLTTLRVVSQFVGPTAATTEFIIDTKQGDVFAGELSKEFQRMVDEDYDTAVPRFLDLYGENMALYVASKSRSLVQGLEVSEEFGAWTQENEALINEYKNVAAYFAPKGSDFNFAVWRRQLEKGYRENLTAEDMLQMAQERIGAAKYRQARRMFGAYPSEKQRAVLAVYRQQLHERFPGFPRFAEFVTNKFENDIADLTQLVDNPRVADSPVSRPLKDYLERRSELIRQLGVKTLKAKGATEARGYLYRYGDELARMNPEFDRIWDRLLAQEVDE